MTLSCAQPYSRAKPSAARFPPSTAKCKCTIPHSARVQCWHFWQCEWPHSVQLQTSALGINARHSIQLQAAAFEISAHIVFNYEHPFLKSVYSFHCFKRNSVMKSFFRNNCKLRVRTQTSTSKIATHCSLFSMFTFQISFEINAGAVFSYTNISLWNHCTHSV